MKQTVKALLLPVLLFLLAVLFQVYGIICIAVSGFFLSGVWIWQIGALFCAGFGVALLKMRRKAPCPLPAEEKEKKDPDGEGTRYRAKKRRRIWMKGITVGAAVLMGLCFGTVEGLVIAHMHPAEAGNLDYIIVLGARVVGEEPGEALRHRIETAADYLHRNPKTVAILSGGQGSDEQISEAECMHRCLVRAGIDASRLIVEDRSTSTSENMRYSYELIPEGKTVGILTNNFHVFRARKLAEKLFGRKVEAISAPYPSVLLPHYLVREFFTVTADFLRGNF